ncbi:hypothetical protein [Agrobacterium tumefaciens]|uniref:hypothetical protein n=1 Tax=Agrobacterium tumefaciens TaxID=358 RepID=UPI0021D1CDBE|nr:hypothetical protein [Agrobacterium tumefaciens]UXS01129.1 hypothetical protein FY156_06300 [Agrobacterium tumefaciens]
MSDRPILFSGEMVRALLAGRKTQTRRVLNPQPANSDKFHGFVGVGETRAVFGKSDYPPGEPKTVKVRIGIGDQLWVRETWQGLSFGDYLPTKSSACDVRYAATDPCADLDAEARGYPWRPSIFMPRWASRITLLVKDVRIERLQDISDDDAIAEGVEQTIAPVAGRDVDIDGFYWPGGPKRMFASLWDRVNGKGAWDANPWVVAYTFVTINANVDKVAA